MRSSPNAHKNLFGWSRIRAVIVALSNSLILLLLGLTVLASDCQIGADNALPCTLALSFVFLVQEHNDHKTSFPRILFFVPQVCQPAPPTSSLGTRRQDIASGSSMWVSWVNGHAGAAG